MSEGAREIERERERETAKNEGEAVQNLDAYRMLLQYS